MKNGRELFYNKTVAQAGEIQREEKPAMSLRGPGIYMSSTFQSGVRLPVRGHARRIQTEHFLLPALSCVRLPLDGSLPAVSVGDTVAIGQPLSAGAVFASVSGRVTGIGESVVVENDGEYRVYEGCRPFEGKLQEVTPEELCGVIGRACIAGTEDLGAYSGKVRRLIVRCFESDPCAAALYRLMLENPAAVVNGTKILLKALGLRCADMAVTDDGMSAADKLNTLIADNPLFRLHVLRAKYPQDDDRRLIHTLTGVELSADRQPAEAGYVLVDADAAAAVFESFTTGVPRVEQLLTIDGHGVAHPQNLYVRSGVLLSDLLKLSGLGDDDVTPETVCVGGVMRGHTLASLDIPVVQGMRTVTLLSAREAGRRKKATRCIACGRCAEVCPMHLLPGYLARCAEAGKLARCEKLDVMNCVGCGACSYVCPAGIEIAEWNRRSQAAIRAAQDEKAAKQAEETEKPAEAADAPEETEKSAEAADAAKEIDKPAEAIEAAEDAEKTAETTGSAEGSEKSGEAEKDTAAADAAEEAGKPSGSAELVMEAEKPAEETDAPEEAETPKDGDETEEKGGERE